MKLQKSFIDVIKNHTDIFFFFLSILIIIAFKFVQFPSLTYHAEVFAESGTNYFANAYSKSFFQNIFLTDAGYLTLVQRIIAVTVVKYFGAVSAYPYFTQAFAVIFIAAVSSLPNLNFFKQHINSKLFRFILGISIGLISDYELNAFINFMYYGIVVLFFLFFVNLEKQSRKKIICLIIISALIILSKGQYIAIMPAYILFLIYHIFKKNWNSTIYYLSVVVASLVQFVVLISNSQSTGHNFFYFPFYFVKTAYYLLLTYRHVFFGYVEKENVNLLVFGVLFFMFLFAFLRAVIRGKNKAIYPLLLANLIAFCSLFLNVALSYSTNVQIQKMTSSATSTKSISQSVKAVTGTVIEESRNDKGLFEVKHFANLRSNFFSNVLIFMTGIILLLYLFPKRNDQFLLLIFLIYTSGAFGQIKVEEAYPAKSLSYSQWGTYSKLLTNRQYCIPLNNYPDLLGKNCDVLVFKNQDDLIPSEPPGREIDVSKFSKSYVHWSITAVVLITKTLRYSDSAKFELYAYDDKNMPLGVAKQLVPSDYDFVYYLFDRPVKSAATLVWKNEKGKAINVPQSVVLLGTSSEKTFQKIKY